ncbi:putative reverse transcriptase domain-containing protein [Tanacetum coccineum]
MALQYTQTADACWLSGQLAEVTVRSAQFPWRFPLKRNLPIYRIAKQRWEMEIPVPVVSISLPMTSHKCFSKDIMTMNCTTTTGFRNSEKLDFLRYSLPGCLSGIPPYLKIEFRICVNPSEQRRVAKYPYRLAHLARLERSCRENSGTSKTKSINLTSTLRTQEEHVRTLKDSLRKLLKKERLSSINDKILAAQKEAVDETAGLQREGEVRTLIMDEAHKSKYSIHPGADKMYYNLRDRYWWPEMKKDIAKYVSKCLSCLKVKAEHQRPFRMLLQLRSYEMDRIVMDFVTKLPWDSSGLTYLGHVDTIGL